MGLETSHTHTQTRVDLGEGMALEDDVKEMATNSICSRRSHDRSGPGPQHQFIQQIFT